MKLIRSQKLLSDFEVEASFYKQIAGGENFLCRNQAVIKRKGILTNKFNAVILCVNPGSCTPANKGYTIPSIDPRTHNPPFVQVNSDPTQWQIMRLMHLKKWKQVVMINLSDLCSGNIDVFLANLKTATAHSFHYHSILSEDRTQELNDILDRNIGALILGWGTNSKIKKLAYTALKNKLIRDKKHMGWKHEECPYYYHPKPITQENKIKWLMTIDKQLLS